LLGNQFAKIRDVQEISDLLPTSAESDVAQRVVQEMRKRPQGEYSLVRSSELPWAGKHAAPVYHGIDIPKRTVLFNQ
jgi:hypothetical protein